MSQPQYHNPYAATPYGAQPTANPLDTLLAPARRASIMLFILGGLGLLGGLCFVGMGLFFLNPNAAADPEFTAAIQAQKLPDGRPMPLSYVGIGLIVIGTLALAYFITLTILGFFVRRGNRGTLIFASILTGLGALLSLLFAVLSLAQQPLGALIYILPIVLSAITLVWLIQAIARAGQVQQWQAYFAAAAAYPSPYGYPSSPNPYAQPAPAPAPQPNNPPQFNSPPQHNAYPPPPQDTPPSNLPPPPPPTA